MERKFADIHVHPNLKPFNNRNYPDPEGVVKTLWDKFGESIDLDELSPCVKKIAKELAKASQANLDACVTAKLVCPFIALYPVERQWFDVHIKINPHGRFIPELYKLVIRIILPKRKYPHLGAALSGFPTEFVKKIMQRIKKNKGIDYFNEELLPQMDYILAQMKSISKDNPGWSFGEMQ